MCSFPFNNGEIFKILEREGQGLMYNQGQGSMFDQGWSENVNKG